MVCGNAYVNLHVLWHYLGLWSHSDVSWRSSSHIQDPFTSRGTVTCMFRSHVQLLFTLGRDSKLRYCKYIYHCSGSKFYSVLFYFILFYSTLFKNF